MSVMQQLEKKLYDNCSVCIFVMFVMCSVLLLFSYTDSLTQKDKNLHLRNTFFFAEVPDENQFAVQRYSWKCQDKRCVKTLLTDDDEDTSLEVCTMICRDPPIWPKPLQLQASVTISTIDRAKISFDYSAQGLVWTMLENSTELFRENLANHSRPGADLRVTIILSNSSLDKLTLNTNESYSLVVKKDPTLSATISADNYFGARHGLETLSQLIWYENGQLKILDTVDIQDSPKFAHRGIMVDTARNYFPIPLLKKVVDGMAMAKLNVLHLHATDAVSFPLVLPSVKQLSSFGAYGPDMVYTPEDMTDLVQYALTRGVKVVLEVDAPGHVNSGWNFEGPNKHVICGEYNVFNGHLNPDNEDVLTILEKIYTDLIALTGNSEYFHMGGDEVNLTCWERLAAAKNIYNIKSFWADYTNKMLAKVKSANNGSYPKHVVMWSSPLTESPELDSLDLKVTVQHWLGDPSRILLQGHKVVYSTVGYWYLDCGFGPWKPSMRAGVCDPYTPWQNFYNYRPWSVHGHEDLVLGGEVCLWSEQVEVDTLETRIWPRSAAFAERVWSDPSTTHEYDIYTRFVSFIDKLKSRGIKSAGIWPRWCSQNPGRC